MCEEDCDHPGCRAWRLAEGRCLLCTRELPPDHFAYRSNGTGASHTGCRMNRLGHVPVTPAAEVRLPTLENLVVSGETGFQALIPRDDVEAAVLTQYAAAARRFLESVEGALRCYRRAGSEPVPLRKRRR